MTLTLAFTLFAALIVLALSPGVGMFTVATRTSSYGLSHGVFTILGIISADFVFVTFALLGLATLSGVWGGVFIVIKYLGAGYLIWLGIGMIQSKPQEQHVSQSIGDIDVKPHLSLKSILSSYTMGMIVTLSNPKAILFYMSFFPSLLDLKALSLSDMAMLYLIVALAIGGVMLGIALTVKMAHVSLSTMGNQLWLKYITGGVLIAIGVFIALRN